MKKRSLDAERSAEKRGKGTSSNRVLRTITFVLTPFLMSALLFGVVALAAAKPLPPRNRMSTSFLITMTTA